jgi:hypothetical protein
MAGAGTFPKVTGDTIYLADYNAIQTLVAGVKTTYYGISSTSSQLTANATIGHTTLNYLLTDIDSCIRHQTGSDSGLTAKNQGDTISHLHFNDLYTYATQAQTNQNTVSSSTQLAQVSNAITSNNPGTGWNTSKTHRVTVDFASAAAANYFFQTGGYLYATASYSGGTGSQKDNNWGALIGRIGNRAYSLTHWITGGTVTIAKLYANSVYSANYWQLSVIKNSSTQLSMTMLFQDDAVGNPNVDEGVFLNITSSVGYYKSVGGITGTFPSGFTNTTTL